MKTIKKHYFKELEGDKFDETIMFMEADKNYTVIHFSNGEIKKSGYTLMRFEKLLKANPIYKRIHRTFLVNMNFVNNIDMQYQLISINNGPVLNISRRKVKRLQDYVNSVAKI